MLKLTNSATQLSTNEQQPGKISEPDIINQNIPRYRRQKYEVAIIDRNRRREYSVEEAMIEMYLAGVSVCRVEDITHSLWGTRVSPGIVSTLNKKIYARIEKWCSRSISQCLPRWHRNKAYLTGSEQTPKKIKQVGQGSLDIKKREVSRASN